MALREAVATTVASVVVIVIAPRTVPERSLSSTASTSVFDPWIVRPICFGLPLSLNPTVTLTRHLSRLIFFTLPCPLPRSATASPTLSCA